MWRKRWFRVAALLLVLLIGALTVQAWRIRQTISYVSRGYCGEAFGEALVDLRYEVNRELPAGTTVICWVEHYRMGKHRYTVLLDETLQDAFSKYPISLIAKECDKDEYWEMTCGGQSKTTILQKSGMGACSLFSDDTGFRFGKPILLGFGVRGSKGTDGQVFFKDTLRDGSIEPWLTNEHVFALKVQFDLPGR